MNRSRSAFSPQMESLIKGAARAVVTWVTVAMTWNSLNKWIDDAKSTFSEGAHKVRDEAYQAFGLKQKPETMRERVRERFYASAPVRKLRELDVIGEVDMEKKNGWSFFKVILVLGIVIAVAVFILDRVLPKPYRDEELDEAWDDDVFPADGYGEAEASAEPGLGEESPNGSGSKSKKRATKSSDSEEADPSEE